MSESRKEVRICVSVCSREARELAHAIERAKHLGDLVELRLDCLQGAELERALNSLDTLLDSHKYPFIITLRPAEQGGGREIDSLNRIAFWLDRLGLDHTQAEFADLELDVARVLMEKDGLNWEHVICSHHDYAGIQSDLEPLYDELSKTPARVLKIAVCAEDVTDCIPLFRLLERARSEGRELIAVAMGESGILTRVVGPSRGSFLAYGSLDAHSQSAPGQPTAEDLHNLYRVHKIGERTRVLGVMGLPVSHSLSPHIHNAAFEESGTDAVFLPLEVHDAQDFLRRMVHPRTRELDLNLRGLSVTAPHKISVMEQLDWVEPVATEIGAVNTIVVEGEALRGYNTDAAGFLAPLLSRAGSLSGKEVAVIGSGGAARSCLYALSRSGARVTLFARNAEKAEQLASRFGAGTEELGGASFNKFDIVVNATPLGTRGARETETPARAAQLRGARLVYDLVYNPSETRLMIEAREAGCETLGGIEMFVAQASEQFKLWTGEPEAPVHVMLEAAKKALHEK